MFLQRFWHCRRGNFALVFAVSLPVLMSAIGTAMDVTNIVSAKANLRNALDTAVLAATRLQDGSVSRETVFQNFFAANIAGNHDIRDATATIIFEETAISIKATGRANANVEQYFSWIFGVEPRVSAVVTTYQSNEAIEVAMVLDNTGSMGDARMKALRDASKDLLDILENTKDVAPGVTRDVKAALVPFVTAVNIKGEGFDWSWIDQEGKAKYNGFNFNYATHSDHLSLFNNLGVEWKGCVEARAGSYATSDDPPVYDPHDPDTWDTLFVPYLAPDDPGQATKPSGSYGNDPNNYNNSYLDDTGKTGLDEIAATSKYTSNNKKITETGSSMVGPNRACPTPIVPLTDDFDKLRKAAAGMQYWNGSGTNVSEGLSWGMRVLSPDEPYDGGEPFGTTGVRKYVVLFTDGSNDVFGASGQATKSDYGSYGFLAKGRFVTTNKGDAVKKVDGWVLDSCIDLKDDGVEIFTILLGADTQANRKLYSACASKPENYFPTNDVSELKPIFNEIGNSIAKLHLTN